MRNKVILHEAKRKIKAINKKLRELRVKRKRLEKEVEQARKEMQEITHKMLVAEDNPITEGEARLESVMLKKEKA